MTLRTNQELIELGNLYEIGLRDANIPGILKPSIWVNSGSIDVYFSASDIQPTSKTEMTLASSETNVSATAVFNTIPRWIYCEQNTGTSTKVITTGLVVAGYGSI